MATKIDVKAESLALVAKYAAMTEEEFLPHARRYPRAMLYLDVKAGLLPAEHLIEAADALEPLALPLIHNDDARGVDRVLRPIRMMGEWIYLNAWRSYTGPIRSDDATFTRYVQNRYAQILDWFGRFSVRHSFPATLE